MRSADHITDALASLNWLRVSERNRVQDRYADVQGSVPRYLGPLARVADQLDQRTLRSDSSSRLLVPPVRLPTIGSRRFSVAGPRVWNTLLEETTIFCQRLKIWLFRQSYPDLII